MLRVLIRAKSATESSQVSDFFVGFLKEQKRVERLSKADMIFDGSTRIKLFPVDDFKREAREITKDPYALSSEHLDTSDFNIIFRAAAWAITSPNFDKKHQFCLAHHTQLSLLKNIHEAVWEAFTEPPALKMYQHITERSWRDRIVVWWNIFVESIQKNETLHKYPALYLYGLSGVGKTEFIKMLLSKFFLNW